MSLGAAVRSNDLWKRRTGECIDAAAIQWSGTSSNSGNAYTLSPSVKIRYYKDGARFQFVANHTNTGAATLNISGLGAKDIKRGDGTTALSAGDIVDGYVCTVLYSEDTDDFTLLDAGQSSLILPALVALGNGMVAKTGAGTFAARTITGTSGLIDVTDGDGVSGDPTLDLPDDFQAGWHPVPGSPSYISATALSVDLDVRTILEIGMKVRWKENGGSFKYAYLTSFAATGLPSTQLNIAGNSASSSTITELSVSGDAAPKGHPIWFTYTPSFGGFFSAPTGTFKYMIVGRAIYIVIRCATAGTSNNTNFEVTPPVALSTSVSDGVYGTTAWEVVDNGATVATAKGRIYVTGTPKTIVLERTIGGGPNSWTNANGKAASFSIWAEI